MIYISSFVVTCIKNLLFYFINCLVILSHRIGGNQKIIDKRGSRMLETVSSIAIFCDKWQLKTPFLTNFDLCSSIVLTLRLSPIRCVYLTYMHSLYANFD